MIDGYLDEFWDMVPESVIEKPFQYENPTLDAWWKALYDQQYLYFALSVTDYGNHWPGWKSGGDPFEYDMPVIFFDVNEDIFDGKGVKDIGTGHYRFPVIFAEDGYNITITVEPDEYCPGGIVAYSPDLSEPDCYWCEIAIPFANLIDQNGDTLTYRINHYLGFDITIIDQDRGITTAPQRMAWQNDGILGDCWNNMDVAGIINLLGGCCTPEIFSYSHNFVIFPGSVESQEQVKIYTEKCWTVSSDQPWLTVNPSSGCSSATLTLTASSNNRDTIRSAYIKLYEQDLEKGTILVIQEANPFSANASSENERICIAPNPVSLSFSVKSLRDKASVHLHDACGKLVFSKEVSSQEQIDISALPPGFYIAVVETEKITLKQKLFNTQ